MREEENQQTRQNQERRVGHLHSIADLSRIHELHHRKLYRSQIGLASQIDQTRFIGCDWQRGRGTRLSRLFGRPRYLFDEKLCWATLRKRLVKAKDQKYRLQDDLNINPAEVRPLDVQAVALQLKQSLENTREPIAAGDFHFANMEMKRLHNIFDPDKIGDEKPNRKWFNPRTWPDRRKRPYLSGPRWRARLLRLPLLRQLAGLGYEVLAFFLYRWNLWQAKKRAGDGSTAGPPA